MRKLRRPYASTNGHIDLRVPAAMDELHIRNAAVGAQINGYVDFEGEGGDGLV